MIAGYHLIWTVYGSWLPNDPRGSSSHTIRVPSIAELGELYHGRKKIQPAGWEIRSFYDQADPVLLHERLIFTNPEIAIAAQAFAETIEQEKYTCYGCAIMPDHVHMLIRKHRQWAEEMIANFQESSKTALVNAGKRAGNHPVWGGPGWKVFLDTRTDMTRIADYIWNNPIKAGLPPQKWWFVRDYDGWLPGQGWTR